MHNTYSIWRITHTQTERKTCRHAVHYVCRRQIGHQKNANYREPQASAVRDEDYSISIIVPPPYCLILRAVAISSYAGFLSVSRAVVSVRPSVCLSSPFSFDSFVFIFLLFLFFLFWYVVLVERTDITLYRSLCCSQSSWHPWSLSSIAPPIDCVSIHFIIELLRVGTGRSRGRSFLVRAS